MYHGYIQLPDPIRARCAALINLGIIMNVFTANLFVKLFDVRYRLSKNKMFIHDLQDIYLLATTVCGCEQVNDSLRGDITELSTIIDLFIQAASSPIRPCGMWSPLERRHY